MQTEKVAAQMIEKELKSLTQTHRLSAEELADYLMKSTLMNCHAKGLHSIVLNQAENGALIRVFVAEENHNLYLNVPGEMMSIGFHNHSRHLALVNLLGNAKNIIAKPCTSADAQMDLDEYSFKSKIKTGAEINIIEKTGIRIPVRFEEQNLTSKVLLLGAELHTIYVPEGEKAVWLIVEGNPLQNYTGNMYTSHLDPQLDQDALMYLRPSQIDFCRIFHILMDAIGA